jgi:hypothetical protein
MIDLFIPEKSIGWIYLTINSNRFCVGYLSDFIESMKKLIKFDNNEWNHKVNRIYLDGEGKDLFLTAWKHENILFVVWESEDDNLKVELMQFDYNDFVNEFNTKFELIKENYYTRFDWDSMNDKND